MTSDLEFAVVEMDVVNGLKVGNEALKKVHDILDIDQIENILEETREGIEKQQEIDAILTGALTEEDEDTVLAELDKLLAEEQRDKIEYIDEDIGDQLPDVPEDDISKKEKKIKTGIYLKSNIHKYFLNF